MRFCSLELGYSLHSDSKEKSQSIPTVAPAPHISAQLVIDSATAKQTDYRLILENGPTEIKDLRISENSDQISSADISTSPLQDMAPHDKKDFPGPPIFSNLRPLSLEFLVTFKAANEERYSRFNFLVMSESANTQPYSPTGSEEGLGDGQAGDKVQDILKGFIRPVGSLLIAFPETNPVDGSPNQIVLTASNRQLLINSVTRKAAIQGVFPSGQKIAEQPLQPKTNDNLRMHIVAVEWDDLKHVVGISVDGAPLLKR